MWETSERVPTVVRTANDRVLRVLDCRIDVDEEDVVALYRPTETKGRNVVVSRGMPCSR